MKYKNVLVQGCGQKFICKSLVVFSKKKEKPLQDKNK